MPQNQEQDSCEDREASHCITQNLVGPESCIRFSQWKFCGEAVTAEEINMRGEQDHYQSGNNPRMQGEKPGQSVMPVICAADDNSLKARSHNRHRRDQVRSYFS